MPFWVPWTICFKMLILFSKKMLIIWDRAQNMLIFYYGCSTPLKVGRNYAFVYWHLVYTEKSSSELSVVKFMLALHLECYHTAWQSHSNSIIHFTSTQIFWIQTSLQVDVGSLISDMYWCIDDDYLKKSRKRVVFVKNFLKCNHASQKLYIIYYFLFPWLWRLLDVMMLCCWKWR